MSNKWTSLTPHNIQQSLSSCGTEKTDSRSISIAVLSVLEAAARNVVFDNIHSLRNTHLKMYLKSGWYAINLVMWKCDHLCSEQWYPTYLLGPTCDSVMEAWCVPHSCFTIVTHLTLHIHTYLRTHSRFWFWFLMFWFCLFPAILACFDFSVRNSCEYKHKGDFTNPSPGKVYRISFDVCWPAIHSGTLLRCPPPPILACFDFSVSTNVRVPGNILWCMLFDVCWPAIYSGARL